MKKKEEIILNAAEFIQFYKAGFIDGYSENCSKKPDWKKVYKKCADSFKKRFIVKQKHI